MGGAQPANGRASRFRAIFSELFLRRDEIEKDFGE